MKIPRDTVAICQILEEMCACLGVKASFNDYVHTGVKLDVSKLDELVASVRSIEAALPMITKDIR